MPSHTTGSRTLVPVAGATLVGDLTVPVAARGLVLFPHDNPTGQLHDRRVATALADVGMATLLFGLLTETEQVVDARTGHVRFDVPLLAARLVDVTDWTRAQPTTADLRIGYFGRSTGAAAALVAAAACSKVVSAVVSQSGRPDLAAHALEQVQAPTLLIVGGDDFPVIALNRDALARLRVQCRLEIVPGAGHLFEEPDAQERVAALARHWFEWHLTRPPGG